MLRFRGLLYGSDWFHRVLVGGMPIVTAVLAIALWRAIDNSREVAPSVLSMALFALSYLGLAISLWPHLIPAILGYTAYSYWVFRGKVTGSFGYH
ncbi:hypothetical protein [Azospirillum humicireducens]|uniref:hypothetical protein n=1 Tax=Azospirillum humicireducens TaxID=1226968 RepID=UPI0022B27A87|nr:hypothetical protein [Azospirillum humicireducens]